MRIVIDLQGAQASNRTRGIGRYTLSLTQSILRNASEHHIILALNSLFPDTVELLRDTFRGQIAPEDIRVWDAPSPARYVGTPVAHRQATELIRESFLSQLCPDAVIVTSLFEGLTEDVVTSVGKFATDIPTAVVLYDLIPYINSQKYLHNPDLQGWYFGKLDNVRRADLLLAISESSRQEAIRHLDIGPNSVVNISTAADSHFTKRILSKARREEIGSRYNLKKSFVMYTGGIDLRKNIEGLIRAYADLDDNLRRQYQLAIVCAVSDSDRYRLQHLAEKAGLRAGEFVMTGFVPEDDLVDLYNSCSLFVFPSWHEGFGLPALEAMLCGAPVIGANQSSLPEVIGWNEALFDPLDDKDITRKLSRALLDDAYRLELTERESIHARNFTWDKTAKRAIASLEATHKDKREHQVKTDTRRPKLAYFSPLPPARSGISDYSAELLPELSKYYDIDVISAQDTIDDPYLIAVFPKRTIEWFRSHSQQYDRILYQVGNSHFHEHMFGLLEEIPGTIVLHDFFLSGAMVHMELRSAIPYAFSHALYKSHGYPALRQRFANGIENALYRYPCNLNVLENADGIIVHSPNSLALAKNWYDIQDSSRFEIIPLLRTPAEPLSASQARKILGLKDSQFIVCTFGYIASTKRNHELLEAWITSTLARETNCILIFVGGGDDDEYGNTLKKMISDHGLRDRVLLSGWTDKETFGHYLAAADVGVQLRSRSRGETSAAVLDCMNVGLPVIVNANGSMVDLDDRAVWKLPDDFAIAEIVEALETLHDDPALRRTLGQRARQKILEQHNPRSCAAQYQAAIERFYESSKNGLRSLSAAMARLNPALDDAYLAAASASIAQNMPAPFSLPQVLVDVSDLIAGDITPADERKMRETLRTWLSYETKTRRIEPVLVTGNGSYNYARKYTLGLLDCPTDALDDAPVEFSAKDILLARSGLNERKQNQQAVRELRVIGVDVRTLETGPEVLSAFLQQLLTGED